MQVVLNVIKNYVWVCSCTYDVSTCCLCLVPAWPVTADLTPPVHVSWCTWHWSDIYCCQSVHVHTAEQEGQQNLKRPASAGSMRLGE